MSATDTKPTVPLLTLADRCDRCGASATTLVVMVAGDLLFCGHHAREFVPAIGDRAVLVLTATP